MNKICGVQKKVEMKSLTIIKTFQLTNDSDLMAHCLIPLLWDHLWLPNNHNWISIYSAFQKTINQTSPKRTSGRTRKRMCTFGESNCVVVGTRDVIVDGDKLGLKIDIIFISYRKQH